MFLELAEALDCPRCREAFGLVAFVAEAEGRRVLAGRLGCPLCEVEYPILEGAIDFADPEVDRETGAQAEPATGVATGEGPPSAASPPPDTGELPLRLAALLGVGERSGIVVLLGPGLGAHGPAVARLAERAEVISWLPEPVEGDGSATGYELADLEAGFDPIRGAAPSRWPIRSGFLDGVALGPDVDAPLEEAIRCLKVGARLVIVGAETAAWAELGERGVRELARDGTTWVGERA